jgi:hypothetical protein
MRLLRVIPLLFLCFNFFHASAQDNCASAQQLCANSSIFPSTIGATTVASDPPLPCGDGVVQRSVWFTVLGINAGTAVVTISNIDNNPGLSISAYTGTCGSLVSIPGACNFANGPGGSAAISFATAAGATYYIMVDGEASNQEVFTITATTPDDGIMARPSPAFIANPAEGCVPLNILFHNTTVPHGLPVTYQWSMGTGDPYVSASGNDTNVTFNSTGQEDISLRATNGCGTVTVSTQVTIYNMVPVINYSPIVSCVGQPIDFTGNVSLLPPTTPPTPLNVTGWWWDFGDPGSGASNNSTLQNPTHVFVGSPPFTVTLVVDGTCGPDTTTLLVTLLPPPVVTATAGSPACHLSPVSLTSVVDSATAPISYLWTGPGAIACDTCQNTTANGLPPGGPYTFTVTVTDANGCTATDTASVFINPLPIANAGNDTTVCRYSPVQLNGTASGGTPPYTYSWNPGYNLSDSTIANPIAIVAMDTTYCLTVTDSFGCVSVPDCADMNIFPLPTLSVPATLCATDPQLQNVLVSVIGAGAGSTYNWAVVPPCAIPNVVGNVSSQNFDLSGCGSGSFTFTVYVTDGVTGCIDTVTASYSVTSGLNMTLTPPDTICAGGSSTLIATGATTYAWTSSPPYAFADSTLASQTVSPAGNTTFTVLGTTGTCSQTLSTTVTVNPAPVAVAAPIPNFCGCMSVSLNGTGSTPGMNYQWSSAGGNPITSPASLVTTSAICTTDVFMLVVTDTSTGCTDTATTNANSTPKPAATAAVTPDTICNGVPTVVTLDGTGSDTNAGTTYLWTSAPVVPITNDTLLVTTANVTTTTTFTLTVSATTGCDSTVTATVQIYPPAVLTGNPGALCTTDPLLQDTIVINGAAPGSSYNWIVVPPCATPNVVGNVQSQIFDLSGCGAGNYTFTVIVTDAVTGCVDTISTTVPIVAGVTLVVSNDTTICQGDVAPLTASGALNYAWTASPSYPFADSTQANQNVSPAATTVFTVIGITGVCSDTANITVTVNPVPPAPPINGPINVCEGDTGTMYTSSGGPGATFNWTVAGGLLASGQGNDTITVNWGSAGGGTITLVDTNSFGCPGPPTVLNVTINPLPNTSPIAGPDTMCVGDSAFYSVTNVAGSTYAWSVTGGTYTGSGSTINVTWTAPGTGTVTVVETNAVGCSDTAVVLSVVVNPVPVTPPITGPNPVCENTLGSVYSVLPAGGSTYNWVITGNGVITFGQGTNSITVDWGLAGSATITLTQTNSSGCPGLPVTFNVTINAQPTASATAANDTMCAGSSINLNGIATNGTILWTTSGSGSFSNSTVPNPTYTSAATDTPLVTLTMTVNNPPCAAAVATVQITVLPLPVTSIINGNDTVCANTAGEPYSVTNNPGSTYSWTVTGGAIAGGNGTNAITVDWGAAGSGTVSVTEFNFFGCQGSTSNLNVVINPSPVPITITGPTTICANSIGTYIISPSTAGSNYTWTVTGGTVASPGNDTTDINWTTPGNQTIIVTETNTFGCAGVADTLNVLVNPLPAPPVITGPDTVCQNDISVYYVPITPGYTYSWGITGGSGLANADTFTVTWGAPPSGTITVSQTDTTTGCTSVVDSINIIINPVPLPQTINGTNLTCENDTGLIYDVLSNPGSYYLWTVTGGTITSPNDSTASITVDWGNAGGGTVQVIEVNALGCSTPNAISVTINAQPSANATAANDTVCANTPVLLVGTAINGTVLWQTNGTGTFGNNTVAATTYTPGATDTGTTQLIMIVSNPPCPNDTAFLNITITPAPIVTVTTSSAPADTVCFGNNITLTATGGGTYLWSSGDTTASAVVTPASTGYYYVNVSNSFGCFTIDSILVNVIQLAVANAGGGIVICNIDSAQLSGIVLNAGGGVWTTSGDGTFVPDSATVSAMYAPGAADIAAGTVTLTLTTTGNPCNSSSDSIVVTLDDSITLNAGADQIVYRNQTAAITGTVNGTTNAWWTTTGSGTFVPDSNSLSATYQPSQNDYNSGFIYLVLHATNACNTITDSLRLDFPDIIIPNVFTPGSSNTPGLNDYFEIRGLPAHSKLEVFNRWGMLVFKADNYRNNWDAAELNDDTYYYILNTPPPESRNYHGHVRVIKKP